MNGQTEQTSPIVPDGSGDLDLSTDLDWLSIDDGEEILWASTAHKSSLVPSFAIGIPLVFILIGIPILIAAYLDFKNTNYVVTSRGLYRKSGILSRDVQQIGFDKVQNISYMQTAVGSYFGYGNVNVSTAGSSGVELQFRSVPEPAQLQDLITGQAEKRSEKRDREGHADEPSKEDVLANILTELQAIRTAIESTNAIEQEHPRGDQTDER
ncbi:PH domain-containing protein [Natronocalculus amylovorans]|uniref:PH domain-containing protein n=1 Tax=Natronocalculus amylovorans TaxID=2917812 RepID=A0AAE3FYQ9_9EURY|nr:PH domain-containing protein [Natronocalculus amylovorans]MCL9817340.1 PH domain-containing protein [Natronocalculus amylovorans]